MHVVVETAGYLRKVQNLKLTEGEQEAIVAYLSDNPMAGDEIKGTGGARKVRFARPGKGKRGGYRVITFYSGLEVPVFLLDIYAKNQKEELTMAERKAIKAMVATLPIKEG